ncbi:MAG: serine/threonine-protein kinase [Saprospiraceae bacterium]
MSIYQKKEKFDEYLMEEYIGTGSSAEVWKVSDPDGHTLALKIFAPGSGLDDYGRLVFREEFEKSFSLEHPNILQSIRYGDFDEKPFIIMPFSEQGSLMKVLRERMFGRKRDNLAFDMLFSEEELAVIIHQVAQALIYLKQHGIIHRDIKPDNILIGQRDGEPLYLLTDFGISTKIRRTIQKQTRQKINTDSGMTPAYAPPEVYRGEVFSKSDIFSLGVSVFELATGETPAGASGIGIGLAMLNGADVPSLAGDYTVRFKELIASCMQLEESERCSAEDLLMWSTHYLDHGWWPVIRSTSGGQSLDLHEATAVPGDLQNPDNADNEADREYLAFVRKYGQHHGGGSAMWTAELPSSEQSGQQPVQVQAVEEGFPRNPRNTWSFYGRNYSVKASMIALGVILVLGYVGAVFLIQRSAQQAWINSHVGLASERYAWVCRLTGMSRYCTQAESMKSLDEMYVFGGTFFQNRAVVRDKSTGRKGFMDMSGRMIIPARFFEVGGFNQAGLAAAALGPGKYGMINLNGEFVIDAIYSGLDVKEDFVVCDQKDTIFYQNLKNK